MLCVSSSFGASVRLCFVIAEHLRRFADMGKSSVQLWQFSVSCSECRWTIPWALKFSQIYDKIWNNNPYLIIICRHSMPAQLAQSRSSVHSLFAYYTKAFYHMYWASVKFNFLQIFDVVNQKVSSFVNKSKLAIAWYKLFLVLLTAPFSVWKVHIPTETYSVQVFLWRIPILTGQTIYFCKQCRSRWKGSSRAVSSGSTLFTILFLLQVSSFLTGMDVSKCRNRKVFTYLLTYLLTYMY